MPFGISLGGSRSKSSGKSTTTTEATTTLEGTARSEIQRLDDSIQQILDAFTSQAFDQVGETGGYTRENAIADAQGTVDAIFRRFSEEALPQIYQAQGRAGAYNSTSGQLLANDAYSQAVSDSAQVVMDNISTYAQLGQQERQTQLSALLQAFNIQTQAGEVQTQELDQTSTTESTSTTRSSSRGNSVGIGGSFGF